jgi:hypothetical protein
MKSKNSNSFNHLNKYFDENKYLCPYQDYKPIVIDLGTRFSRYGFATNEFCSYLLLIFIK